MSFGLYWRPAVTPPSGYALPVELKYVLAKRFGWYDGSCREQFEFDGCVIGYLEGLCDGSSLSDEIRVGAKELLVAIKKHGTVKVWIGNADDDA